MTTRQTFAAFCALAALALPATAQEEQAPSPEEMAKMEEVFAKYASPAAEHQRLEPMLGAFEYSSWFKQTPDEEPTTMTGNAEYTWVHDGRYLRQDVSGMFFGMPFKGTGYLGFDRYRGEYFSFWIDNMSTGLSMSRGRADATGNVITFEGTQDDVWEDRKDVWMKTVLTIEGDDAHKLEMFVKGPDDKEFKNFELVYKRAKMAAK